MSAIRPTSPIYIDDINIDDMEFEYASPVSPPFGPDPDYDAIEEWVQKLENKAGEAFFEELENMPTANINTWELANEEFGTRLINIFRENTFRDLKRWLRIMCVKLDRSSFAPPYDSQRVYDLKSVACPQRFLFLVFQRVLHEKQLTKDFEKEIDFQELTENHEWLLEKELVNR